MRTSRLQTQTLLSFLFVLLSLITAVTARAQSFSKENLDERIRLLKQQSIVTCEKHGGINCAAGANPDDGGVICLDGTKAKISFMEFCSKSKLTTTLYVRDKSGTQQKVSQLRQFFINGVVYPELIVMVRNSSPVEAKAVSVSLVQGVKTISNAADGLKDISAFGGEEFRVAIPAELFLDRYGVGRGVLVDVRCDNC